jgi:hypothetical protein
LQAIAGLLGVDAEWLKHGDKTPYPPQYKRLSENPFTAVDWLLSWNPDNKTSTDKVETLHLIRADNPSGGLYLVKESKNGNFLTFRTPINVSEEIGAGGEASLAALFVTLELLYKRDTPVGDDFTVSGYLMRPDDIEQLMSGNTNPGSLIKEGSVSLWWEDIWDTKMVHQNCYWPGWNSLCERIQRVISARTHLNEMRSKIQGYVTSV